MNIYTTIIIVAAIIAICNLANLYASVHNWMEDRDSSLKELRKANFQLLDLKESLQDILEYLKDNESSKD